MTRAPDGSIAHAATAATLVAAAALLGAGCGSGGGAGAADAPGGGDGAHPIDAAPGDGAGPDGAPAQFPHPFGTHGGYVASGVLFPSNHAQAALDAATAAYYDTWKATYLVAGCNAGEWRVKTTPATSAYTVSEGHGYGMLIAVIMDGHDPDARAIFDGLYRYYDGHRSGNDAGLMAWAQDQACADVMGADSATDGDLDIAYALLLADREWGSAGAIDYHAAALRIIASVLASDVHPTDSILVGDWAGSGDPHYTGTRPSDFMTDHFHAFADRAGVARWGAVADHTYAVVAYLQAHAAPSTGLLPDFAVNAAGATPTPSPAPANWLEGADDGRYSYNACRVPWRLATDYLMYGDARAQAAVRAIDAWMIGATGGAPAKVKDGYGLDGSVTGSSAELSFVAPFAVGAMIAPASGGKVTVQTQQAWLDAGWDEVAGRGVGEYYGDTIKMIAMIVMSGNWWRP